MTSCAVMPPIKAATLCTSAPPKRQLKKTNRKHIDSKSGSNVRLNDVIVVDGRVDTPCAEQSGHGCSQGAGVVLQRAFELA